LANNKRDKHLPNIGISIQPHSVNQRSYLKSIRNNTYTIAVGNAGTGKTFCPVAQGIQDLFNSKNPIQRIVFIRPAIPACGDQIGYTSGDLAEKMLVWSGSLLDNLLDYMDLNQIKCLIECGALEIIPLSYLRGRSLNECFVICDEFQNVTVEAFKMVLTRIGRDSKLVITGDLKQSDIAYGTTSGLADAVLRFKNAPDFGIIKLYDKEDIVRNPAIATILEYYGETQEPTILPNSERSDTG
jgi:phosphate starvation-inducible PhoH-like protein